MPQRQGHSFVRSMAVLFSRSLSKIPIPPQLHLLWDRITLSKITAGYFVFSVIHCIIQLALQFKAFSINVEAADFLASIIDQGNATAQGFTVLGSELWLCTSVPSTFSTSSCMVLWNGTILDNNAMITTNSTGSDDALAVSTSASSLDWIVSSHTDSSRSITSTSSVVPASASSLATSLPHSTLTVSENSASHTSVITQSSNVTRTVFVTATVTTGVSNSNDDNTENHDNESRDDHRNFVLSTMIGRRSEDITPIDVNGTVEVIVNGLGWDDNEAVLDRTCLWALNWPVQVLRDTEREDVTFIAFQFWVLGTSTVALLNESIPHVIASLLTHMLATAWAGFQIYNTAYFQNDFERLTTNGACDPIDLLPTYWSSRAGAEIPSLVFNAVALLVSAFLSWRLAKLFGWQTFKRVGACMKINRIYRLVLTLSIVIQLSLFFMVVSVALWIDQLWNGAIGQLATSDVYKPVLIITLILMIPWLTTGWFAVRKELKTPMLVFLILSFGYLAGWAAMFASTSFRWTFVQWRFFSLLTSGSVFLTLVCFALGIWCRTNFGKGLPRHLNSHLQLAEEGPWEGGREGDLEKIAFPSTEKPFPTFSAVFAASSVLPSSNQMSTVEQPGNAPTSSLETHPDGEIRSQNFSFPFKSLHRHTSSQSSQSSSSSNVNPKRWIIE